MFKWQVNHWNMQCPGNDNYTGYGVNWLLLTVFKTLKKKKKIASWWLTDNPRYNLKARDIRTVLK